jgi:hypothetical protein
VWQVLVQDFYTYHRSETPLFPFVAGEFAAYLMNERKEDAEYPFLAELAQYEWSEIALQHSDEPLPTCWPLVFRFPVQRIGVDYLPQQAPEVPTCLLVYRCCDGQVRFMESTPATVRLLQLLQDADYPTLQAVCERLALDMQHPDVTALARMVDDTLQALQEAGVIKLP